MGIVGIRKEDRGKWERRAPIAPFQIARAIQEHGLDFHVESSTVRIAKDEEYAGAGATIAASLDQADIILGVKEVPLEKLLRDKAYVFFSHTIKGQDHNMPMLQRLLDLKCTLLDYERIADEQGRRQVFFGYHAGLAGMIDSLWLLGLQLARAGFDTPLKVVRQALHYDDLQHAAKEIGDVGKQLAQTGVPRGCAPLVLGFAGYGNVSNGAQFVSDLLPTITISPEELPALLAPGAEVDTHSVYKVVFKEEHMARRTDGGIFQLQEYYQHPELYTGVFDQWIPYLTVLVNCIYWEPKYPRLLTRTLAQELDAASRLRLLVVGDITCDIDGSVEMTTESTTMDDPVLMYSPKDDSVTRNLNADGIAVLAVDNLPAELPLDSTLHFGDSLFRFLPALAGLDRGAEFKDLDLLPELKRALIVWNGKLTPDYEYLEQYL